MSSAAERRAIIARYGLRGSSGRVILCTPSRAERAGIVPRLEPAGTDDKVAYPSIEAAEAAARELEALGAAPMYAYFCRRSTTGHVHLASE